MGMVGGGQGAFIGAAHRMAAALDGQIELVCGAFSRSHDNTLETGRALGLADDRLYENFESMFAEERTRSADDRMEFVAIVTPNHLHVPIALAAAKYGFHIMCDKPAGVSYEEVAALSTSLHSKQIRYALSHTYLGYPMVWQARHIASNTSSFGAIRKVYIDYPQGWLSSDVEATGSKQAEWRTDPALAGLAGCMGDIGTHAHNLVEFITASSMTSISARLRAHVPGRRLDDDGEVFFTLANGATGVLTASQVCAGEENGLSIRIYGEHSSLEWRQMAPNTLIERSNKNVMQLHRAGIDRPLCDEALSRCRLPAGHPEGYIEAFANIYRDFARSIRERNCKNQCTLPDINSALRGMAFLEAVVESSVNNSATVHIAGNFDASPEVRGVQ